MINRTLSDKIKHSAQKFPVVSITGPRQSGKTTLIKETFPNYEYFNLEDTNIRTLIETDPTQFVNPDRPHVIFDEIQKVPELLSQIQVTVDEVNKPGLYIISGSENLLLSEKISQSLAGRVSVLHLLPLSADELKAEKLLDNDAFDQIPRGFYPRIYDQNIPKQDFYSNYVTTYIERDVRQIKNIGEISDFQRFMQLIAGRVGQLFNSSSISNDLGIDHKTINSWLSVLETSFITFRLQPYFKNFGKRVIKSPKVYFYDVGLLAYLLGIDSEAELETHFARGALFENLVIAEALKKINNLKQNIKPYFWRDRTGNEIDLLLDKGGTVDRIEIKSSKSFNSDFFKGFSYWDNLETDTDGNNFLVYNGTLEETVKDTQITNWKNIGDKLFK